MVEPSLVDAGRLLQRILFTEELATASQILEHFFRERHSGQQERARVTEIVFYALRHRRRLEAVLRTVLPGVPLYEGLELACAALVAVQGGAGERLPALLGVTPPADYPVCQPGSIAEDLSLPDWLWQRWQAQWGTEQTTQLGESLNQPAPVDLRVNALRASREAVLALLTAIDVRAVPTPYAPMGLRLQHRQPLHGLAPFKQGLFEVQDEGSQLLAPLLAPEPGWNVVDLCAGGGGKSLHLAALMGNRGKILATDTDQRRLSGLGPRRQRAGARIIRTLLLRHERDPKLKPLEGRADAVLVDAPCSGSGTLRRHPEMKWRLQAHHVEALHDRQCALLEAGARLARPKGRLLYATCSLLQRENQDVVHAFLADNKNFRLLPATMDLIRNRDEGLPSTDPFFMLLPHQTGTDGFFAALFQRVA